MGKPLQNAFSSRRFPLKTRKLQMNALDGVKMNGWVTEAADCALIGGNVDAQGLCDKCEAITWEAGFKVAEGGSGLVAIVADYRSTNPKKPGEGKFISICKVKTPAFQAGRFHLQPSCG